MCHTMSSEIVQEIRRRVYKYDQTETPITAILVLTVEPQLEYCGVYCAEVIRRLNNGVVVMGKLAQVKYDQVHDSNYYTTQTSYSDPMKTRIVKQAIQETQDHFNDMIRIIYLLAQPIDYLRHEDVKFVKSQEDLLERQQFVDEWKTLQSILSEGNKKTQERLDDLLAFKKKWPQFLS